MKMGPNSMMGMKPSNRDMYGNPCKGQIMTDAVKPKKLSTMGPMKAAKKAEDLVSPDKGYSFRM